MTDFQALCAELLEIAELYSDGGPVYEPFEQIINKARAALAQPESQGPTDEELRDLWSWAAGQDQGPWPTQQHCFARAVLARWGRRALEQLDD